MPPCMRLDQLAAIVDGVYRDVYCWGPQIVVHSRLFGLLCRGMRENRTSVLVWTGDSDTKRAITDKAKILQYRVPHSGPKGFD